MPLIINVDGIERNRAKWNALGRAWYRIGELCSVLFASTVVADAEVIAEYYRERYHCTPAVITYGAQAKITSAGEVLKTFGLDAKRYILYVARLEPENNALGVVEGYKKSGVDLPLVVVGDAPYAKDYIASVKAAAADANVIFTGYQFGSAYQELQSNCSLYIQATEVGGTHPALIEAMAYGNAIIANETPENVEVLGAAGEFYRKNDFTHLAEILKRLISSEEGEAKISRMRSLAVARASERYNWDRITDQYEELFRKLAVGRAELS